MKRGRLLTAVILLAAGMYLQMPGQIQAAEKMPVKRTQAAEEIRVERTQDGEETPAEKTQDGEEIPAEKTQDGEEIPAEKTGWQTENGQRVYYLENGKRAAGFTDIEGDTYYFWYANGVMRTGWVETEEGKRYLDPKSGKMVRGFWTVGKDTYYFEETGIAAQGWRTIGGQHYYFWYSTCLMAKGWCSIGSGDLYCFDKEDGHLCTGLLANSSQTIHIREDGSKSRGWQTIGGNRYYFWYSTGMAARGWADIGNGRYYFDPASGRMYTGLLNQNAKTYYLDPGTGLMAKGWRTIDNRICYFWYQTGEMARGWADIGNGRYYFWYGNGARAAGFANIGNNRYYFQPDTGMMQKGWKTIEGRDYYFWYDTGVMVRGFRQAGEKLYYYDPNTGVMARGWQTIKGSRYYFWYNTGDAARGWQTISGNRYYFDPNDGSRMAVGLRKIGGKQYYFDKDGKLVTNKTKVTIENGIYNIDSNGVLTFVRKSLNGLKQDLSSAVSGYYGTWSVYVQDLNTGEEISVNNQSMYAASLIKLYAMGAAYEQIRQGRLSEGQIYGTISPMITVSSNDAFNSVVRRLGITYVNEWCKKEGYTQTNQGHGLGPSSNNYGLNNGTGDNTTSVQDCGRFLADVFHGKCVNPYSSQRMEALLKQQERRSKLPAGIPSFVTVGNKTGETSNYAHDAAIVYLTGHPYVICVMSCVPGRGYEVMSQFRSLSRMTYNFFAEN